MVSRALLVCILTALLIACGASTIREPGPATGPATRPVTREDAGASTAIAQLLSQSRQALLATEYNRASVLLQRAQRIDPRNPEVYLELARLHSAMGDLDEARTMAERGMLYCDRRTCTPLRRLAGQ